MSACLGGARLRALGLCVLVLGCSRLPDYAAPTGRLVTLAEVPQANAVRYRKLRREDFRAAEPPAEIRPYQDRMSALTCAHIRPSPDARVVARGVAAGSAGIAYRAEVKSLRFEATMDPACSWWNPSPSPQSEAYVLQHEQIHFALFELAARRLNREAATSRGWSAVAETPQEAVAEMNRRIDALLRRGLEQALRENREFDEDTSLGHRPDRQAEWLRRVEAALAAR